MRVGYFAFVRDSKSAKQSVLPLKTIRAVASPVQLTILSLLKDSAANFPPQTDGDLARHGVCAGFAAPDPADRRGAVDRDTQEGLDLYRRGEPAIQRFTDHLKSDL